MCMIFSVMDGFGWFWMGNLDKNIQLMLEFFKARSCTFPANDLPDDAICNIAIYADDTTLYSKCDKASDLWQWLELISELESHLQDSMVWVRKWLVDFNAEKINWVCLTGLIRLVVLLIWKLVVLFLRKNNLLRCWGWLNLLNWIGAHTLWSFFLRLLCISINLPYSHAWDNVVMFRLVVLVASWNC